MLISGCWNRGVPLYTEVSSFQGVGIEGFHCKGYKGFWEGGGLLTNAFFRAHTEIQVDRYKRIPYNETSGCRGESGGGRVKGEEWRGESGGGRVDGGRVDGGRVKGGEWSGGVEGEIVFVLGK